MTAKDDKAQPDDGPIETEGKKPEGPPAGSGEFATEDPRQRLEARLQDLGIRVVTHDHPPVFTVDESNELHQRIPGAHTKNLFLKDAKGRLFLVIADHRTEVALKTLHKRLGAARFSFGKAELLEEVLGVKPGSVTAFAVMNDTDHRVTAVLDRRLMACDTINAHPMRNDATTSIARDDLLRFLSHNGHDPVIIALNAEPDGVGLS